MVIDGSWQLKLDDTLVDVRPSDVFRVAPEIARGLQAGPDGLDVIGVGGRRPEGGDGFWV